MCLYTSTFPNGKWYKSGCDMLRWCTPLGMIYFIFSVLSLQWSYSCWSLTLTTNYKDNKQVWALTLNTVTQCYGALMSKSDQNKAYVGCWVLTVYHNGFLFLAFNLKKWHANAERWKRRGRGRKTFLTFLYHAPRERKHNRRDPDEMGKETVDMLTAALSHTNIQDP